MNDAADSRHIDRAEAWLCGVIVLAGFFLHFLFFRLAGALWRDEIDTLSLVLSPSMAFFWRHLDVASVPAFGFAVMRFWTTLFGHSLVSLRLFGVLNGLGLLGAVYAAGKRISGTVPLFALAVVATDGVVVRFGDAYRANGFGAATAVLAVLMMWIYVEQPSGLRAVLAAGALVLTVQCGYYNAVVVLAVCTAASLALGLKEATRRFWWRPLSFGAVAAVSLLPYIPVIRARSRWTSMEALDIDSAWIARRFVFSMSLSGPLSLALLTVAAIVAIVISARRLRPEPARVVFALGTLVIFPAAFWALLRAVSYGIQPWYFLVLLVLVPLSCDLMLSLTPPTRLVRIGLAVVFALSAFPAARAFVSQRQTNMDLIASLVSKNGAPADLVVVYPWYCGVSFDHYYRGPAPWFTMPPLHDYSIHQYLEAKSAIEAGSPFLAGEMARVRATLVRGGKVWLVGFPLFEESGAPAQRGRPLSQVAAADLVWCTELKNTLRTAAGRYRVIVEPDPRISLYERVTLTLFEGPGAGNGRPGPL